MTDIDVTEIRIILEDLTGKKNVLIREIMTKISHDIVIQELDELGAI